MPTDGSKLADQAAESAMAFARDANASVVFVHVVEPFRIFTLDSDKRTANEEDYERWSNHQAAMFLAEAERRARDQGVACYTVKRRSDQVHEA